MTRAHLFILLISLLSGCSNHHPPAPVSDAALSTQAPPPGSTYTVAKGDTLFTIAWLTNSDPTELAALNQIPAPYQIFPGQQLFLKKASISNGYKKDHKKQSSETSKNVTQVKNPDKKQSTQAKTATKSVKKLESKKNKAYPENSRKRNGTSNSLHSKIRWQWPTSGKIIERFSSSEQGNKGIDINGKRGQPVYAAAEGSVVYAGSALRGYGKLLIIKHDDDYLSAYAHNHELHVKERDRVKAGQHIADLGNTDAKRDMLHFEIRFRGKSVDPEKLLPRR